MDLRIENPKTTEGFVERLRQSNVKLPLRPSEEDVGVILDAEGADVLTVDSNGDRENAEVEIITLMIVLAVNTCGGFKAVQH